MRCLLFAGAALAILAVGAPTWADTRAKPTAASAGQGTEDALLSALTEAKADMDRGDAKHAREVLQKAKRRSDFAAAPSPLKRGVLLLASALAFDAGDLDAARTDIVAATALAEAEGFDWSLRLQIAGRAKDDEDIVRSMTVLAARYPATLGDFNESFIYQARLSARALPDGETKAFALDEALAKGAWKPEDPFADNGEYQRDYAQGLLARDRTAEAEKMAADIFHRDTLIAMRADKRFDAIGGTGKDRFSPRLAAVARLKAVEALLKTHPDRLSGQNAKAEALLALNRPAEALAVAEAAVARANGAPKAYRDMDDMLPWTHNLVNTALERLGRGEEALAALAAGARVPENGQANVSQTLNLSAALAKLGRSKEALATVSTVRLDLMSPYGKSVGLYVRAVAATQLNDTATANNAVADLRALGVQGKLNLFEVLTYRGDLDAAAALLIERLNAPTERSAALLTLQDTPLSPFPTPYEVEMTKRIEALSVRPDVRAAIAKVGRIERYAPGDLWPER